MGLKINQELFEEFWKQKGQYLSIKNGERFRENLGRKIDELGTVEEMDHYVMSLRTGREKTRQVVVEFYEYLMEKKGMQDIPSCLFQKVYYDYPFTRQLEIAKFLHEPKTPLEIRERFDIDERTMRKDLQELEEGITVLGSKIQIVKEKKGRSYFYRTTLHPIFLPLNLTEVYALTVYLDRVLKNQDGNAVLVHDIASRIKSQLSDYAYEKLFPNEKREEYSNEYLNDEILARQRKGILMYLMKSGAKCKFLWENMEYYGRIDWVEGEYRIRLEDDTLLDINPEKVEFVIESLEYK